MIVCYPILKSMKKSTKQLQLLEILIKAIVLPWLTVFFSLSIAPAETFRVAPHGNDNNPGTKELPFLSLQYAFDQLNAGDTLIIGNGSYKVFSEVRLKNSGTPDEWIVIMAEEHGMAVVDAEEFTEKEGKYPHRLGLGTIQLEQVSYVKVEGLHVRNSRSAGYIVRGPSEYVHLIRCSTDRSYNSGIGIWYSDYVKVLHCEVTRANEQEMRPEGAPMRREAPHEAISVCGANYFEVAYNHVHQCFKEGIDVKEVSKNGVVHHNYIHDLPRQGLYVDAWFGLLHNVEFHSNVVHDCEWGFAISAEGEDAELKGVKFHHNILFDNRASGIIFGVWNHDQPRSDIEIHNNTIYNNGTPGHWAGSTGGIDIRSKNLDNVKIYNNIIMKNWSFQIATAFTPGEVVQKMNEKNIVISDNITGAFKSIPAEWSSFGIDVYGLNTGTEIITDPLFKSPETGDFSIPFDSPAAGNIFDHPREDEAFYFGALKPGQRIWVRKF